ncbi:efflux RND transporter permease subunit [Bacteroides graminisolvens]|uniref:efflux RND transporter permease subunit n=1 Tax=Bacteroides graminisolvens TaxID=477666 RepID=UPI00240A2639|nr:efflux RND transporter permease subunit [Bacteroides graminisolvens]
MLKTFINRPALATVISIFIVVLGIIGLVTLPIETYPDIAPPTVQIQTTYTGANADVIMKSVVIPIEEAVNGVEGMAYMTSSASNSGAATVTVYFRQGIDPDIAAVNVQNLVSKATPLLPQEVTKVGVTVQKQQTSTIMMITLTSDNTNYDDKFLQNYANINILPQIKRIYGVGNASVSGAKDYSMRIWFKPDRMTSYKINPSEVIAALTDQNIEAAPGELGQNSNQSFQYTLKYTGRYNSAEEFGNIIVRHDKGQVLRLKDVANIELGALNYSINSALDGKTAVAITVNQTAGSNARELINNIKTTIDEASKSFPTGLKITYVMDSSEFLDVSIHKVISTLIEAFILVFIVVFVFLQNVRSTLIPAIAVPVAIIGTFFFLQLFGFSINLLTLFALVLAIGIVVDDAIVVVEAVHAQMDNGEKNPKKASIIAMKEIAPAIVSITLIMASVFIPVSFIGGTTGVFFKQFGLTLAVAILISAVNALTLSPALCAIVLKPHDKHGENKKGFIQRFYQYFNLFFDHGTTRYKKSLHFLGKKGHRWITIAIIATSTVVLVSIVNILPKGFIPAEDSGSIMGMITLPPGSSLERSDSVVTNAANIIQKMDEVDHVLKLSGLSLMNGSGSSYASLVIKLKPWNKRKRTVREITAILTEKTKNNKEASFLFTATPTLQGFGLSTGVDLRLQDKTGGDINKFYKISQELLAKINTREEVMLAMSNFNPNFPQKEIHVNMAKIKEAGLTLNGVMTTIQAYVGSMYVSNFNLYGKQYRVMVQAAPEFRSKLDDLNKLSILTGNGEMAPITEFISIKSVTGAQSLARFNMFTAIDAMIIPNFYGGYSTGDLIKVVDEVATEVLPAGYSYEYSGMSREEANSSNQIIFIFGLCLIFVYLLLVALYESYILPLCIILSLPIGLAGIYIFIMIFGLSSGIVNNIYVQISLIMLIGLLAKNAILIVEYAVQRRQAGMSIIEAAINGAVARLRPILMTSFAFICGLLPLMFANGAGAIGNKSIGISAVGGMLIGTILGILVIPSLYIIFQTIQEKISNSGLMNLEEESIDNN